jgi:hypothetical protein
LRDGADVGRLLEPWVGERGVDVPVDVPAGIVVERGRSEDERDPCEEADVGPEVDATRRGPDE